MSDDEFWMTVRQLLLGLVDAIERWRGISPRTAELRHALRRTGAGTSPGSTGKEED